MSQDFIERLRKNEKEGAVALREGAFETGLRGQGEMMMWTNWKNLSVCSTPRNMVLFGKNIPNWLRKR